MLIKCWWNADEGDDVGDDDDGDNDSGDGHDAGDDDTMMMVMMIPELRSGPWAGFPLPR